MMWLRLGGPGPGPTIGCGALLALLGLILISPVGAFLIKALGWIVLVVGVAVVVVGVLAWLSRDRPRLQLTAHPWPPTPTHQI